MEASKNMVDSSNPYRIQGLSDETLFRAVSDSADTIAVYIADMESGKSIWSDFAIQYFDFPEDYQERVTEIWLERIHPDDRDGYSKDIGAVFGGQKNEHYYQYRVKNQYGEYIWVECHGCVKKDPESRKSFFIGYIVRLDQTAIFDPVTNCLNIKEFYGSVQSRPQTFVLLGIDAFRKVINRVGFTESNDILRILGELLQKNNSHLPVYRMTGDEFLLTMPSCSVEELEYLNQKTQKEFSSVVEGIYPGLRVKYSCAATYYNPDTDTKEAALKRLEHTLDYAKQCGSGTFAMYSPSIEEKHDRIGKIQEALTRAIENQFEGFYLVYQPVIRSDSHEIDGAEALLRFYSPELGLVSPAEFIPLLESSGVIIQVGLWVAEKTILQKIAWDQIHPGLKIGFNSSLFQYRNSQLTDRIVELVEQYRIPPEEIVVELTETQKMDDPEHMRKMLQPLVDHHVWIVLDDFGMEASTFTLVQELPIHGIKVDHSFVRTMIGNGSERKDKANIAIVSSINHMARQLGLRVIVEGVENENIDHLLVDMGIRFAQGYYYSRPVRVEEFEAAWL